MKNLDRFCNRVVILGCLGLLQIWDAAATLISLSGGFATELNPLMRIMYGFGPEYFLAAKAFLVLWGSLVLGFAWEHVGARRGALYLTLVYAVLGLYEAVVLILHGVG